MYTIHCRSCGATWPSKVDSLKAAQDIADFHLRGNHEHSITISGDGQALQVIYQGSRFVYDVDSRTFQQRGGI